MDLVVVLSLLLSACLIQADAPEEPPTPEAPTDDADGDGYDASVDDCDDEDASIHPGADEVCNGVDDNCDGATDEGLGTDWYEDLDGDGFGDGAAVSSCDDLSLQGYTTLDGDCGPTTSSIHPDADELCNGVDDNCDGSIDGHDAIDPATWWRDADGDGYGDPHTTTEACDLPSGYADNDGDCDDTEASFNTGIWYGDADGDYFGDPDEVVESCPWVEGTSPVDSDCDDSDPLISPSAVEVCNDFVDNDCDGAYEGCGYGGELDAEEAADQTWTGESDDDRAGSALAPAWDVDGDGYDELLIGAPDATLSSAGLSGGAVYLVDQARGSDSLEEATATWSGGSGALGGAVLGPGDLDGDGYADVVFGDTEAREVGYGAVYVVLGPVTSDDLDDALVLGHSADGEIGSQLFFAGDVDGDGSADLLVGNPDEDVDELNSAGRAYLLVDAATGSSLDDAAWTVRGDREDADIGDELVGGDVDGDGFADVFVADLDDSAGRPEGGTVFLFRGPLSGDAALADADASFVGTINYGAFGSELDLGDFDGDGHLDLAASAAPATTDGLYNRGVVHVVYAPGSASPGDVEDGPELAGTSSGDYAGRSLRTPGDVDGDGLDDLLVGTSDDHAWLVSGPISGSGLLDDAAQARFASTSYAGTQVAGAGDHDADGFADFVIADDEHDTDTLDEAGAVWVFYGGGF